VTEEQLLAASRWLLAGQNQNILPLITLMTQMGNGAGARVWFAGVELPSAVF
jgi:hypothetical protein